MHTDHLSHVMTEQHFVLKWHYHETTLIRNLPYLLENDILSDVTISVGAHNVRAHRIILAMCSVYFLQLFQDLRNTQHPVIVLHNVGIDDVKAMLAFMYKGQCVVSKEQLPNLLSVAKLLKIQGLCDMKVPEREEPVPAADTTETFQLPNFEKAPDASDNYNSTSINVKRQSGDAGSNVAINLSSDSKSVRSSTPPTWEKPLRVTPENASPCSPEGDCPYPSLRKAHSRETSETCKCFLCGKYLSNQYNLRVHMETHEEAYHACQSCPHVSRSRDALRKHVSYRHPEEYVTRKRRKTDNS
ncbi:protein bric-a-brac 2-like [Cylas formicarius]|uniref:protein bric-a-brac 2-like n=1 Tax=Cylas formicarius TaxID=197179 RepID=UPI00295874A0|nr:protein bric-a-brac 2-like [Cylas formicarius]XP_060522218.1 protein bric-a-brac 2-like [Cylas formicarius]